MPTQSQGLPSPPSGAARMAQKIMQGTKPAALPPEPPEVTVLVLNQKTAATIGINIPPALQESAKIIK